jgi:hypothetical protein
MRNMPIVSGSIGIALALSLLSLSGAGSRYSQQSSRASAKPQLIDVGMVALLAAPQRYDGAAIRTQGFACIEFEGDALYLHEEDYKFGLTKNAFRLRLSDSQRKELKSLNLKYAIIEATLHASGPEQRGIWSGVIGEISRFEAWPVHR